MRVRLCILLKIAEKINNARTKKYRFLWFEHIPVKITEAKI